MLIRDLRLSLLSVVVLLPLLQGCALAVAGGAAGSAYVAMDARDVGTQVDDNNLRLHVQSALNDHPELSSQRVLVVAYNGNILAYGQVSEQSYKDQAIRLIRNMNGVNRVYDQLRISPPVTFAQRSRDTLLTSRVKTALVAQRDFDHSDIKVYSEANEVFLVGRTSRDAAANAIEVARNINGVERVIDVIERS